VRKYFSEHFPKSGDSIYAKDLLVAERENNSATLTRFSGAALSIWLEHNARTCPFLGGNHEWVKRVSLKG
jgi:hypothetical protein